MEKAADVLRYGEYLTDDQLTDSVPEIGINSNVRIRTIKYEGHVYYHKMVDGEVAEFKRLL